MCPNTTRNDSRRAADRRTNQLLGSVLDGASCVQREPPPRPPEERAEPAVASCSRPPKDALGKKHRHCLQPAGGLPPAGQRDGGGGHAADRRRPVRDGARAARRLLRGDLRDLRRPRLRPARQRERRLLQVQHRRGAASPPRAGARDGRFAQVRSRRRCEQPGDVACVLPEARAEIVDDDVDDGIFAPPNASSSPSSTNNYFVVVSTQHAGARWIAAELAARQCVTAGGEFFAARDAFHWTARAQRRALAALFSGAGAVDDASPKFAQWVEAVADPRRRRHFYTRDDDSAPPRRRSTVVATDKCARSASGGCSRNASPRRSTRGSRGLPPRAASGSSSWGARTSCASPSPSATRAAASVTWIAESGGAPAQRRAQANGSRPVTLPTGRRLLDLLREERHRAARQLN